MSQAFIFVLLVDQACLLTLQLMLIFLQLQILYVLFYSQLKLLYFVLFFDLLLHHYASWCNIEHLSQLVFYFLLIDQSILEY